jgi:hypothetical protein
MKAIQLLPKVSPTLLNLSISLPWLANQCIVLWKQAHQLKDLEECNKLQDVLHEIVYIFFILQTNYKAALPMAWYWQVS